MLKRVIQTIGCLLLGVQCTYAAPAINSASGSFTHKGTITLNGSGFGAKNPAAPLMWDDMEHSHSTPSQHGWSEALPSASGDYWKGQYRTLPFRNVSPPHQYSTSCFAGGHEDHVNPALNDYANGYNVSLTVSGTSYTWFSTWYERYDPLWPGSCLCGHNTKIECAQTSASHIYTGTLFFSMYSSDGDPCISNNGCYIRLHSGCCGGSANENPKLNQLNNPRLGWIRQEFHRKQNDSNGFWKAYTDNEIGVNYSGYFGSFLPNSYSVGGFYRYRLEGCSYDGSTTRTHDDAFRYFDDVYIDKTMARVMLANNQNYSSATIIEPQIPSAWSAGSITCTVNLGNLPDQSTSYLFVFDSNNDRNSTGFPVTIGGGGDQEPPTPPTGLRIEE